MTVLGQRRYAVLRSIEAKTSQISSALPRA